MKMSFSLDLSNSSLQKKLQIYQADLLCAAWRPDSSPIHQFSPFILALDFYLAVLKHSSFSETCSSLPFFVHLQNIRYV